MPDMNKLAIFCLPINAECRNVIDGYLFRNNTPVPDKIVNLWCHWLLFAGVGVNDCLDRKFRLVIGIQSRASNWQDRLPRCEIGNDFFCHR